MAKFLKIFISFFTLVILLGCASPSTTTQNSEREPASNNYPGYAWVVHYNDVDVVDKETGVKIDNLSKLKAAVKRFGTAMIKQEDAGFSNLYRMCEIDFLTTDQNGRTLQIYACRVYWERGNFSHFVDENEEWTVQFLEFASHAAALSFKQKLEKKDYDMVALPLSLTDEAYCLAKHKGTPTASKCRTLNLGKLNIPAQQIMLSKTN